MLITTVSVVFLRNSKINYEVKEASSVNERSKNEEKQEYYQYQKSILQSNKYSERFECSKHTLSVDIVNLISTFFLNELYIKFFFTNLTPHLLLCNVFQSSSTDSI